MGTGTPITVYDSANDVLYSYTTSATSPNVTSGMLFNTGNEPFAEVPVYIGYSPSGVGTTTFDY